MEEEQRERDRDKGNKEDEEKDDLAELLKLMTRGLPQKPRSIHIKPDLSIDTASTPTPTPTPPPTPEPSPIHAYNAKGIGTGIGTGTGTFFPGALEGIPEGDETATGTMTGTGTGTEEEVDLLPKREELKVPAKLKKAFKMGTGTGGGGLGDLFGSIKAFKKAEEEENIPVTNNNNPSSVPTVPSSSSSKDAHAQHTNSNNLHSNSSININTNTSVTTPSSSAAPSTAHMHAPVQAQVQRFRVTRVSVLHPSHRLSRRIKMWDLSSGFSLSTPEDIQTFVKELQKTSDGILLELSQTHASGPSPGPGVFGEWVTACRAVREREIELIAQNAIGTVNITEFVDKVTIDLELELIVTEHHHHPRCKCRLLATDTPREIAAKICVAFAYGTSSSSGNSDRGSNVHVHDVLGTEAEVEAQVLLMLASKENQVAKAFDVLQRELSLSEDFSLYQEEIIDNLVRQNLALRSSPPNQRRGEYRSSAGGSLNDMLEEFSAVDKDGNGLISKDEWRAWIEEKHRIIRAHNTEKSELMAELRALRMAMSPSSLQALTALKRSEEQKVRLEDELIKSDMDRDAIQADLQEAMAQIQQLQEEKQILESHYLDQIRELTGRRNPSTNNPITPGNNNNNNNNTSNNFGGSSGFGGGGGYYGGTSSSEAKDQNYSFNSYFDSNNTSQSDKYLSGFTNNPQKYTNVVINSMIAGESNSVGNNGSNNGSGSYGDARNQSQRSQLQMPMTAKLRQSSQSNYAIPTVSSNKTSNTLGFMFPGSNTGTGTDMPRVFTPSSSSSLISGKPGIYVSGAMSSSVSLDGNKDSNYSTISYSPYTNTQSKRLDNPLRQALRSEQQGPLSSRDFTRGQKVYNQRSVQAVSITTAMTPPPRSRSPPLATDQERFMTSTNSYKSKTRDVPTMRSTLGWK